MTNALLDLHRARADVTASSAGGAPFLIAFGLTIGVAGLLGFYLPVRTAAIVAMFQGGVALPLAFWLERRMGTKRMDPENPLRPLSIQLAMSQTVALPVVILVYSLNPIGVPAALAAIAGGHFLPYAWLQRTRIYAVLGAIVSLGGLAITIALGKQSFPYVLLFLSLAYFVAAVPLYRRARELAQADAVAA